MRLTSTQIDKLWEMNVAGGTWLATSAWEQHKMKEFESYGLVEHLGRSSNMSGVCWKLTPKGMNVSLLHKSEEPVSQHSVAPDLGVAQPKYNHVVNPDGSVVIEGQPVASLTEIMVKGRQGTFIYLDTHRTKEDRYVLNLLGPVGIHKQFCGCYLEDARLISPVKAKRKYTRRAVT